MRSVFGWSYPPGCSGPPDDWQDMHPLSEKVFTLLEERGVEQSVIDEVVKGIEELAGLAYRECPHCEARAAEKMAKEFGPSEVVGVSEPEPPEDKP